MSHDDRKMEIILEGSEVPALLKALGEVFCNPVLPEAMKAFGPHLAACEEVGITLRQLGGMAEFTVKAKGLPSCGPNDEAQMRPSFTSLKKRLQTSFKYLQHCRDNMILPPQEVLDAFLNDSRAMSEHPRRGPGDYVPCRNLCDELERACAAKDREGALAAFAKIEAARRDCHVAAK